MRTLTNKCRSDSLPLTFHCGFNPCPGHFSHFHSVKEKLFQILVNFVSCSWAIIKIPTSVVVIHYLSCFIVISVHVLSCCPAQVPLLVWLITAAGETVLPYRWESGNKLFNYIVPAHQIARHATVMRNYAFSINNQPITILDQPVHQASDVKPVGLAWEDVAVRPTVSTVVWAVLWLHLSVSDPCKPDLNSIMLWKTKNI